MIIIQVALINVQSVLESLEDKYVLKISVEEIDNLMDYLNVYALKGIMSFNNKIVLKVYKLLICLITI